MSIKAYTGVVDPRQTPQSEPLFGRQGEQIANHAGGYAFAEAVQAVGGWGRGTKRAVAAWYAGQEPRALAYQLTKYARRNGWTHRDLLRLAHPVPAPGSAHGRLYHYAVSGAWTPGEAA